MSQTDELLANAKSYAKGFDKGDLPLSPGKKVAVLVAWTRVLTLTACSG